MSHKPPHTPPPAPTTPQSNKHDVSEADFRLFLVLWNQRMNQRTPQIHLDMALWLETAWKKGDTHLLLMAFRSAGKSTIVGLFAAWLLYRKADLRILVLAADQPLAAKMVRNVKRILERHPLTPHLLPDKPDQWAADRFTVKRMLELRDPSMLARGIGSNITGSRADIVICDDVEVPNTCETAEKRENLRNALNEMEFVLVPGGTQLYVGTPHTYFTIYAESPRAEIGEERAFLDGFKRLKLPILNERGESAWIERYSEDDIMRMRVAAGPNKFASQMMLRPVNIAQGRFNPDLLRFYGEKIDYVKELNPLYLSPPSPKIISPSLEGGGKGEGVSLETIHPHPNLPPQGGRDSCTKLIAASAYWDPAFGSAKGDHSVLAVVYGDADGNYYLHHMAYIKTQAASETDEATQQCRIVAEIARAHYLPSLIVETNGIGKFLPNILRNELAKAKAPAAVKEISQSRNKAQRILESFDALLAARRLYVHESVKATPFLMEMREWRPDSTKTHDDGLDAAAGALAAQPDRLARIYGQGGHNWMNNAKAHKAHTDFKV